MKGLIGARLGQRKGFESLLVENQPEIEKWIMIFCNQNVYHALDSPDKRFQLPKNYLISLITSSIYHSS